MAGMANSKTSATMSRVSEVVKLNQPKTRQASNDAVLRRYVLVVVPVDEVGRHCRSENVTNHVGPEMPRPHDVQNSDTEQKARQGAVHANEQGSERAVLECKAHVSIVDG